jgi:hypothetical protein
MRIVLRAVWFAVAAIAIGIVSALLISLLGSFPTEAATIGPQPMSQNWLMNNTELATLQAAGYNGPTPEFVQCDNGGSNASCTGHEVPSYMNYYALRTALRRGVRGYVTLDLEGWTYTPHYQSATPEAEAKYYRLAAELCKRYGVRLIATPVTTRDEATIPQVSAAKYGAWGIDLQIQFATSGPKLYQQLTETEVAAIRKVSKRVVILDGIASDAGGYPTTARLMWSSYERTKNLVDGYWLNDPVWITHHNGTPATGCATTGCPGVTMKFLQMIGA